MTPYPMTLPEAERVQAARNDRMPAGTPIRLRPVIVALPDDDDTYTVVTLGFAQRNELTIY